MGPGGGPPGRDSGHLDHVCGHQRPQRRLDELPRVQRLVHGLQRVDLALGHDAGTDRVGPGPGNVVQEVGIAEVPARSLLCLPAGIGPRDVVGTQHGAVRDQVPVRSGPGVGRVLEGHAIHEVLGVQRVRTTAGLVDVAVCLGGDVCYGHEVVRRGLQAGLGMAGPPARLGSSYVTHRKYVSRCIPFLRPDLSSLNVFIIHRVFYKFRDCIFSWNIRWKFIFRFQRIYMPFCLHHTIFYNESSSFNIVNI
mmetsp:Transcript_2276/g.3099  ORF Transcript_2276/g.3099 Transcript_2276/m.3099 type:complete len:250 (-) Transcript_2276:269-1018(-)